MCPQAIIGEREAIDNRDGVLKFLKGGRDEPAGRFRRVAALPGLSRPCRAAAPARGAARRVRGSPTVHAAHAEIRAALHGAHVELRTARLGVRRGRLSVPADPPRDRTALAAVPRRSCRVMGRARRLCAAAASLPDQFLWRGRQDGAAPGSRRGGFRRRRWCRCRSAIPACSASAEPSAAIRRARSACAPATPWCSAAKPGWRSMASIASSPAHRPCSRRGDGSISPCAGSPQSDRTGRHKGST